MPVMCARVTRELMVLHAVWIDEMSVSRSFRPGLARAISHMYRVSVMPVYSHTSGKTGTATDLQYVQYREWELGDMGMDVGV